MSETDRIERSIRIQAPAERVWQLICEPGWFINDGALVEHRIERDGDLCTVHDPVHGAYTFRILALDEPRYAAFRWLADPTDPASPSTDVEFWITPDEAGGVRLTVVESGFDALPGDATEKRRQMAETTEGWEVELDLARRRFEGADIGA